MLLITLAIFFAQNDGSDSAVRSVLSLNEFSSGMPLP
jgi:hypothetical protein